MSTPVRVSDRDLRALAAIVSDDRPDLTCGEGLPPSLLADLMGQILCDGLLFQGSDSKRQVNGFKQGIPAPADDSAAEVLRDTDKAHWAYYWDCQLCCYPDRTGDVRSITKVGDFYSQRQWHSTGMYGDIYRPLGINHVLQLCLLAEAGPAAYTGRTMRLCFFRGPGQDFAERDRALLVLLRPHVYQAYLDAKRRSHPVPRLTRRQNDLLRLLADGHTNTQIARRLGITEGTVRTHLENIYERLGVSSRTAAVTRAFPSGLA